MSKPVIKYPQYAAASVIIANSTTVSAEIDLADYDLVGIFAPSTMDGTDITFTASETSGGTFVPVAASNAASTAYKIVTAPSTYTPIDPDVFTGLRYIKLVAATAQTTTDTLFRLALRKKT